MSTHTTLPAMAGAGPDDADLYDGGASLPCLPPATPQDLVIALLLQGELCTDTPVDTYWFDRPPVGGALCPLAGFGPAPLPSLAILQATDKVCVDVGVPGLVMAGKNGQGIRARARAAAASVAGVGPPIANGAQRLELKVEDALDSAQYGQAFDDLRELQRDAVYGLRAPQSVVAVGEKLVRSRRIPDTALQLPISGTSTVVRVFTDVKFWRATTLDRANPANKLVQQVNGLLSEDLDSKVLLEFLQTAVDPIDYAPTVIDLLASRGVDVTRVGVRLVGNPNSITTLPAAA